MEYTEMKKSHFKVRILRNISCVLAVCMLISTGVSYLYFQRVVRTQKISDERSKQEQVARQISFMMEDISNFARSIIVDDDIQKVLEDHEEKNMFEDLKTSEVMSKRLRFYNSMRSYILGSFIQLETGKGYVSSDSFREKDYLAQRMAITQIRQYVEESENILSDPYYGIDSWDFKQVVCYGTRMMDKYHLGESKGAIYLEISLDYFLKQVEAYGKDYESVCLMGNNGCILYEENKNGENSFVQSCGDYQDEGVHKIKGGYLICKDINSVGWKLCVMITDQYLWERCSFVLKFLFISFMASLAIILLTTSRLLEGIVMPITYLSRQMEEANYEMLHRQKVVQTGDEIQTLYECYNAMVDEIQRGIERKMEYEKRQKDMEFDIMLSQINPHYLYNVLNTVVYLAAANRNREVVRITNSLIFSLQETMKLGKKNIETTIRKELELTECYLNIQQYRYPDIFQAEISCEEEFMEYLVPKTIIQPLVENAILHGILPCEEPGKVTVSVKPEGEMLCITVEDDGEGISETRLQQFETGEELICEENGRKHIGISNVRDRIQYLYGKPYGMQITRMKEKGTRVTLYLPLKKTE